MSTEIETNAPDVVATDLRKVYGARTVVDGISLKASCGECVGLLGPNGAGKTTTFYMLVGLVRPDGGRVLFRGKDVTQLPVYRRARIGLGYLAQEASVFRKLSVRDNLRAVLETMPLSRAEQKARLEELLEALGLTKVAKQMAYTLSGGERRKLEIARALVRKPAILMLDEPFAIQNIVRSLKAQGIGVIITDHNVRETLDIVDRAYIVFEGRILCEGTSKELLENPQARQSYLGENFRM